MPPSRHYTQAPSELRTTTCQTSGAAVLHIRGGGFLTRDMVHRTLGDWKRAAKRAPPENIIVDLRDVAGYESGCVAMAHTWLRDAHDFGVRRIAFLANSSVLRTATQLAAQETPVDLRLFDHELAARRWLDQQKPSASSTLHLSQAEA